LLSSIFLRNRSAFLALVGVVAALKLVLSAIEPASWDLRDIIALMGAGNAPIGPWIALYPPLYNQTASNISQLQSWPLTASLWSTPNIMELSLLFRVLVFIFDIGTMVVLYYIGRRLKSSVEGRLMGLVWFLNPFSLFAVELLGLPDVTCVFLITLSLFLLISQRPLLSAVAIGLGAFVRFFPIFLFPPLLLYIRSNGASRKHLAAVIAIGLVGLGGYLSWVLPYGFEYLTTPTPVTFFLPFLGGAQNTVNVTTFGMFAFYCIQFIFMKKNGPLPVLLSALLAYFVVAEPGPQYLIWLLPLIAVDVVAFADKLKRLVVLAFLTLGFAQWFLLSSAFVTPSGYSLLMFPLGGPIVPGFSVALGNFLDSNLVDIIILPLVASSTFALLIAYATEQMRVWFSVPEIQSNK